MFQKAATPWIFIIISARCKLQDKINQLLSLSLQLTALKRVNGDRSLQFIVTAFFSIVKYVKVIYHVFYVQNGLVVEINYWLCIGCPCDMNPSFMLSV